jgi:hypothetical protein
MYNTFEYYGVRSLALVALARSMPRNLHSPFVDVRGYPDNVHVECAGFLHYGRYGLDPAGHRGHVGTWRGRGLVDLYEKLLANAPPVDVALDLVWDGKGPKEMPGVGWTPDLGPYSLTQAQG